MLKRAAEQDGAALRNLLASSTVRVIPEGVVSNGAQDDPGGVDDGDQVLALLGHERTDRAQVAAGRGEEVGERISVVDDAARCWPPRRVSIMAAWRA